MTLPAAVRSSAAVTLLASTLMAATAAAADWPQWRGPARDGHLAGYRAPSTWPAELKRGWTVKVGQGHSSPVIAGGRVYSLTREGEEELTTCLDLETGRQIWQDRVAAPFDSVIFPAQRLGKSPRSTPLVHQGKLYTLGVNGLLTCFHAADGKVLWRKEFAKAFRIPMPICGASLSPLIDGERLYVHAGHGDEGAFFALNKDTGAEIWSWKGEGPAYTSPTLATVDGVRQLITASHNQWIGLDPESGKLLWNVPVRQNMFNHQSVTPVVVGNTVVCGQNQRSTFLLRLGRQGDSWKTERVWETRDVTMSTGGPVQVGERFLALNEKRRGQLVLMEMGTGKVLWGCEGSKGEHASIYVAGKTVLLFTIAGELHVYELEGDALKPLQRYQVAQSATWASPAFSGSRMVVKGVDELTLWTLPQ